MKRIFYLLTASLLCIQVNAQTPGGVAGSVLWLKANDGASPTDWLDKSGSANNFSQGFGPSQPAVANNVFNFNPAVLFDGTSKFYLQSNPTGFPTNADDRTIIVIAKANAFDSYRWILKYGTPGFNQTCQMGTLDGALANDFFGNDHEFPGYWNGIVNGRGALATFTLASSNGTQYNDGLPLAVYNNIPSLSAASTDALIGSYNGSSQFWDGPIAEILMFNSSLSAADQNKVESYLALKYGFSLGSTGTPLNYTASDGTVFWTANAGFQNNVFGIGRDDASGLLQNASNSIKLGNGDGTGQTGLGNVVVRSIAALTDKQFYMIGDDGASMAETTIGAGTAPANAVGSVRVVRNWKVQNTGAVGSVDISIDTVGLTLAGGSTLSNFRLIVDEDGDGNYTTGTVSYVTASSAAGTVLKFSGVSLPNNAVFSLITQPSAALLPALLQTFDVTLQKNKASLTWKTSSEINVDHYTVDYSVNTTDWFAVGTVAAKNGAGVNIYTISQDNLPIGRRYYRIKRVDRDGRFEYSMVKSIRVGGVTTLTVKGNPIFKNRLEFNIDAAQSQDATVRVVSTAGVVLLQQKLSLSAGDNAISTSLPQMASGTYLLQVQTSEGIINKKFVRL
jgi:hypothetical protein